MFAPEALAPAIENYGDFANVRGVSFGQKYSGGVKLGDAKAVQFFVSQKKDRHDLPRPLPEYVFGRTANGDIDRTRRIPTDVIELRNLRLCCRAGDEIAAEGTQATVCLLFVSISNEQDVMALSCSHVIGDMRSSPSSEAEFIGGRASCVFKASPIANTVIEGGELEYDIALLGCKAMPASFIELTVGDPPEVLTEFLLLDDVNIGYVLNAASDISGNRQVEVASTPTTLSNISDGREDLLTIGNLIPCRGTAVEGDSGGLVHVDGKAFGILVASADDDWLFVQSLPAALAHLELQTGRDLRVFKSS